MKMAASSLKLFPKDVIEQLSDDVLLLIKWRLVLPLKDWMRTVKNLSGTTPFDSPARQNFEAYFKLLDNVSVQRRRALLLPTAARTGSIPASHVDWPGPEAQMLHQLRELVLRRVGQLAQQPRSDIGAMIALDEITDAMGATRVIPGSHNG